MNCTACNKPLHSGNVTGLCRTHFNQMSNRDPEVNRRRAEGVSRFARENPVKASEQARKANATRMANPEYVKAARERMRTLVQPKSYTPEAIARRDVQARSRKAVERWYAWCPQEYRHVYRELKDTGLSFAEAKQLTLDQIAADKAKEAKLSPFERQERALRNGIGLIANVRHDRFSPTSTELREKLA